MTYCDLFGLTKSKLSKEFQFEIDEITAIDVPEYESENVFLPRSPT